MKKMLASKKDHQQCKIDGLEYLKSFYTLCPLIISSNTCLRLARRHIFASPVAPSSLRRPVFASPFAPSSLRPSSRLRLLVSPSSIRPFIASSLWYRCIL
ncbi:hypothetical protein OUZ56_027142 [Daphnia magna]|uniref:Uncharacterized protein n=1 Tax=Daphnia magna TaxID=35525 RepID=A0ABQ9ZNV9_9CRUS|nr:hypothetical protein OUZ56_027142 [Daphnia magna]